jgi:hypothetical protein
MGVSVFGRVEVGGSGWVEVGEVGGVGWMGWVGWVVSTDSGKVISRIIAEASPNYRQSSPIIAELSPNRRRIIAESGTVVRRRRLRTLGRRRRRGWW